LKTNNKQEKSNMKLLLKVLVTVTGMVMFVTVLLQAQELIKPNENFYDYQQRMNQKYEVRASQNGKEDNEDDEYRQFKRFESFIAPRVYPTGEFPKPDILFREQQKYIRSLLQQVQSSRMTAPTGNWESLGPSSVIPAGGYNYGLGRVNNIAIHPNFFNIIYAATAGGGLWKTTDGGLTWSNLTDFLPVLGITDIVIDPFAPKTLYIATGDANTATSIPIYSVGVLKSTDGGLTWAATGLTATVLNRFRIYALEINTSNSSTLIAATNGGVFKTTDGGTNWVMTQAGRAFDVKYNPADTNIVYAVADSDRVYLSGNSGNSFALQTIIQGANRLKLAVTPANPACVYVLASNKTDNSFLGVFRSLDSGVSYNTQSTSPNIFSTTFDGSDNKGQGSYALAICASPTNANQLLAGGGNVWSSPDGGVTWFNSSHWSYPSAAPYVHADQHQLVAEPFTQSTFYSCNDGGLFKTTDNGVTWSDLSAGLVISQFVKIGVDPDDNSTFACGAQDLGILVNYGGTWYSTDGADGGECVIHNGGGLTIPCTSQVYHERQNGDIYNSCLPFGLNNSIAFGSLLGGAFVTPYVKHPTLDNGLYIGYSDVWEFDPFFGGAIFPRSSFGLTSSISAISSCASNPLVIYCSHGNTLFKTFDLGTSWTSITAGLPVTSAAITSIAVDDNDPNHVYVTFSGYSVNNKVFETTDGGASWLNLSSGLPNLPVNTIVHDDSPVDGIYIGTDVGVYYRDKEFNDWQYFSGSLPNTVVTELEISRDIKKLRAATFGRGVWQSDLFYDCIPAITVNDPFPGGSVSSYTAGNIYSSAQIDPGADVTFVAASVISLSGGFRASDGSHFIASIANCTPPQQNIPRFPFNDSNNNAQEASVAIVQGENTLTVYPNPAVDHIIVNFSLYNTNDITITITDLAGRVVNKILSHENPGDGKHLLKFSALNLKPGMYMVNLISNGTLQLSTRMIKM
jgi:photosystem II stability/assembly factor-like uncharacterized protein